MQFRSLSVTQIHIEQIVCPFSSVRNLEYCPDLLNRFRCRSQTYKYFRPAYRPALVYASDQVRFFYNVLAMAYSNGVYRNIDSPRFTEATADHNSYSHHIAIYVNRYELYMLGYQTTG